MTDIPNLWEQLAQEYLRLAQLQRVKVKESGLAATGDQETGEEIGTSENIGNSISV